MGVFRNFPYTNFHELNMDEILKMMKNLLEDWGEVEHNWETMQDMFDDLREYVENYFDDPHVAEIINQVVAEMIDEGIFLDYAPRWVTEWMNEHFTESNWVLIDRSLTVLGGAADAKYTGDALKKKINLPIVEGAVSYGSTGQFLKTNGDGSTEWVDYGIPTDEQTQEAIDNWLNAHPEATTTVADGSITPVKLDSNLKITADMFIHNEEELRAVIENPVYDTYFLASFTVNNKIVIPNNRNMIDVHFVGGTITLNSPLFTNDSIEAGRSPSWAIPSFIGTTFVGDYAYTLFDEGFYILGGYFTSCVFRNVSFVYGSNCVQSTCFTNCRFIANRAVPMFINANAMYDVKFSGCDLESDFEPLFINVEADSTWGGAGGSVMRHLTFVNCISEGRTKPLVRFHTGDVEIYGHYAEGNTAPLIDVYQGSNTYSFHTIAIYNSFLNTASNEQAIVVIENDLNYENTSFICIGCVINGCMLVNTNKFLHYLVENNQLVGNTVVYPARVMSKVGSATEMGSVMGRCYTNGIAFFKTNSRTIYIMPEISMITFATAYSGTTTTFVIIAGTKSTSATNPSAFAYCISHPNITITSAYNSELGMVELTLPDELGVISQIHNASAVGLRRIYNDATGIDYYRSALRNGYTPLEVKEIFTPYEITD